MIEAMIEAAKLAREADCVRPSSAGAPRLGDLLARTVEVLITEDGWVVRGETIADGYKARKSIDLTWPEFEARPSILPNAVSLVVRSLEESERSWAP